jgi:hypothetical protein
VDNNTRLWLNTLPKNSIDPWDDMRLEFVKHFQYNYSRTTSIDDLEKCIQLSKESTRKWLHHRQDTWVRSSGMHPSLTVNTFKCCCRYEPLVAKIKRILAKPTTDLSVPELIEIAWCYAQEDPMPDLDDESTMRGNQSRGGPSRQDHHGQDLCYSSTRHTGKRSSPSDLVANTGQDDPRDPKAFRRDVESYRGGNGNYMAKTQTSQSSILRLC